MKLWSRQAHENPLSGGQMAVKRPRTSLAGFTLVEVMVAMLLFGILLVAALGGLFSMDLSSRRLADNTAAMTIVEAKVQDIKGLYYNPPNAPFGAGTVYLTNSSS